MMQVVHLAETNSTISWLREHGEGVMMVVADYQTDGRGQGGSHWESERGKNLLFSIVVHPVSLPVERQYLLSEAHALALKDVLDGYADGISVKWPNDIYWNDCKLSGTLIETVLSGGRIKDFIIGTGLNVNQQAFFSDAPNPVSLYQILGHEVSIEDLTAQITAAFERRYAQIEAGDYENLSADYHQVLYRRLGFHAYCDQQGRFEAEIVGVEDSGQLLLRDRNGAERRYGFKEVKFL